MVKTRTVFILGAGASCPYGYPSGRELRQQICSYHVADCESYLNANSRITPLIPQELRRAGDFANKFRKSSTKSIDLFLARNPEFTTYGKRAILFRIFAAEKQSRFREETKYKDQDWYSWLFEQLTQTLVRKEDYSRFGENCISFVTFNYDRSLEFFLYESLINSFNGVAPGKIVEQLDKIRIIHVFGQAAPLRWQGQDHVMEYAEDTTNTNVEIFCDNLRIIYEKSENLELDEAQEVISKASRVFFLGFGYAQENLDALGIPAILNAAQHVYGTALALTKREINRVKSVLKLTAGSGPEGGPVNLLIEDLDCLALLRKYL